MSEVTITDSHVTILIEVDGQICVTQMKQENYDAVALLARVSVERLVKTEVTQEELNKFLLPSFFEEGKE